MARRPKEEGGRVPLSWLTSQRLLRCRGPAEARFMGQEPGELTRAYTYILSHYPSQEALPIDR